MVTTHHEEIAHELMEDFYQDFSEAHQRCEHTLIALEHDPQNAELLNDLFRSIHTVKGNLVYVGLKDVTPLIQSVEDILDAIRKGTLGYDTLLSDVILLTLDNTHSLVEARVKNQTPTLKDDALDHLCQVISQIAEVGSTTRTEAIRKALALIDPGLVLPEPEPIKDIVPPHAPVIPPDNDLPSLLTFFGITVDNDMQFFIDLNAPLESRSRYWQGRTGRQLKWALAMNKQANEPVEPAQLAAAVILHDVGMAFLPVDTLHNSGVLNNEDLCLLHTHPQHGHTLLTPLKRWTVASTCILQHHERMDGSGYPGNLRGEAICDGAKIISIVDTFEARTHERAHSNLTKRPFIRAILEINSCADSQFDSRWVEVFNQVARTFKT